MAWNNQGVTQSAPTCVAISTNTSKASSIVVGCMCGNQSPYIRCMAMLGNAGLAYHKVQQRKRRLNRDSAKSSQTKGAAKSAFQKNNENRELQVPECALAFTPTTLGLSNVKLGQHLDIMTNASAGVKIKGECCIPLEPPPLNVFEVCGEFAVSIPNDGWLNPAHSKFQLVLLSKVAPTSSRLPQTFISAWL